LPSWRESRTLESNPVERARPVDTISVMRSKSWSGNTPSTGALALKLRRRSRVLWP
jgi:hypothetical protein